MSGEKQPGGLTEGGGGAGASPNITQGVGKKKRKKPRDKRERVLSDTPSVEAGTQLPGVEVETRGFKDPSCALGAQTGGKALNPFPQVGRRGDSCGKGKVTVGKAPKPSKGVHQGRDRIGVHGLSLPERTPWEKWPFILSSRIPSPQRGPQG